MRGPDTLRSYLPASWQAHLDRFGLRWRQAFLNAPPYPKASPALARRDAWPPGGGLPGSDLAFLRSQLLDPLGIDFGILQVLSPSGRDEPNLAFGAVICRAINDWQLAEWMAPEPRLKATINVPLDDADEAVAEIERCAALPGFVGVALPSRSSEPLGRKRYWPIFAAAARHGLPLCIHTGGTNGVATTGAGWPSFYMEDHHGHALSMQAALSSLIFEGVFDRHKELRAVMIEAGFAWAAPLGWRMDKHYLRLRDEVPHLRRLPSEIMRQQVWYTTQPVDEAADPGDVVEAIGWLGWDRLLFSTDYPHWDMDDPRYAFKAKLSEGQKDAIFWRNAWHVFGFA
jgi:predicted TIM-barrel fold metal-dependent hydrolase